MILNYVGAQLYIYTPSAANTVVIQFMKIKFWITFNKTKNIHSTWGRKTSLNFFSCISCPSYGLMIGFYISKTLFHLKKKRLFWGKWNGTVDINEEYYLSRLILSWMLIEIKNLYFWWHRFDIICCKFQLLFFYFVWNNNRLMENLCSSNYCLVAYIQSAKQTISNMSKFNEMGIQWPNPMYCFKVTKRLVTLL